MFLLGSSMRDSCTDDLNETNNKLLYVILFTITGVNVDIVQLCQQQESVYAAVK